MIAIEAEIGTGEFGTSEQFRKPLAWVIAINIAIVVRAFANRKTPAIIRRYCRPNRSRRIDFLANLPLIDLNLEEGPEIARAHPKLRPIPSQRLRCHSRRRMPFEVRNLV